jgi:hypothetical protein
MKQVLLFLSVVTFILFTSCEKAEELEPEPYSFAIDLQNGYWETHFTSGEGNVIQFNTSTVTSYWIEGTPCILDISTQGYTLEGNMLTIGDNPVPFKVEIQDNTLSLEGDGHLMEFERKETLDYPEC